MSTTTDTLTEPERAILAEVASGRPIVHGYQVRLQHGPVVSARIFARLLRLGYVALDPACDVRAFSRHYVITAKGRAAL